MKVLLSKKDNRDNYYSRYPGISQQELENIEAIYSNPPENMSNELYARLSNMETLSTEIDMLENSYQNLLALKERLEQSVIQML